MAEQKTPAQLAEAKRRDVMRFAYKETNGNYYMVSAEGKLIPAVMGGVLPDGNKVQALSPEYQKIAEQTAALVMMYDKVLAVEPAQRGMLIEALKNISEGRQVAEEGFTGATKTAWGELKGIIKDAGISIPGADTAAAVGNASSSLWSGVTLLPTFLSEVAGLGTDVAKQLGGGRISRENAIAIGTAYASARQSAAEGRPQEPGLGDFFEGLFSKNFGSYFGAGFAWVLDKVMGFVEHIPGIGDWIKKQGWHKDLTLAQHLERSSREDDSKRVEYEMGKFPTLGGVKTEDLVVLTRKGGVVRDASGKETQITGANKDNAAPTGTTPEGESLPQSPDAAAAARKENEKPVTDRVGNVLTNPDNFSGTKEALKNSGPVGVAVGAAITAQATRGIAEGYASQGVRSSFSASDAAEKAHTRAAQKVATLEGRIAQQVANGGEASAKLTDALKSARAAEVAANAQAEKAAVQVTARTADMGKLATAGMQKIEGGFWKTTFVDSWRYAGRAIGRLTGMIENAGGALKAKETAMIAQVNQRNIALAKDVQAAATGMVESASLTARGLGTYVAPIIESGSLITGILTKNERLIATSSAAIYTITAGVAAGAAGGAVFAGIGALPGAVAGLIAGSVTAIGASHVAGKNYDARKAAEEAAAKTSQAPAGALGVDPALNAVAIDATQKARAAEAQAQARAAQGDKPRINFNFAAVDRTSIGAVSPHAAPAPTGIHVAAAPQPVVS